MENWMVALVAALPGLIAVLILILRPAGGSGADPQAMAGLQAGMAALRAELSAESARHAGEIALKHQAMAMDQTRVLRELLDRAHDGMIEGFGKQERAHITFTGEHRDGAARAQAALIETLTRETAALSALLDGGRQSVAERLLAQERAHQAFAGEHRDGTARGRAEMLETLVRETAKLHELMERKARETREEMEARLAAMRESNDARLADIQRSVNEQLAGAVEKQMNESFNRVIDQFSAIQRMMGDVQAVTSQVGDLKRLFGNVKARGGWGEGQVRALLDDILPPGSWETNVRLRDDSLDVVEFAVAMPMQGEARVLLAVDAKFPTEDYERMLLASEAADAEAERAARLGLQRRIRDEAAKIASKYICPPRTAEFAVLYLPTDGLYAEVARMPGMIDEIGRLHRVVVMGPSLLPALLRTIQLGHVTLALSRNAEGVRDLLSATKAEMAKMDTVLERLGKQVGTVTNTIGDAQRRTRAIKRKLREVEAMPGLESERLLEIAAADAADDDEA